MMLRVPVSPIRLFPDDVAALYPNMKTIHFRFRVQAQSNPLDMLKSLITGEEQQEKCATSNRGGITVVYQNFPEDKLFHVGFAVCRPDEFYENKKGRNLAIARLQKRDEQFSFQVHHSVILGMAMDKLNERHDLEGFKRAFVTNIQLTDLDPGLLTGMIISAAMNVHKCNEGIRYTAAMMNRKLNVNPTPKKPKLHVRAKKLRPCNHPEYGIINKAKTT